MNCISSLYLIAKTQQVKTNLWILISSIIISCFWQIISIYIILIIKVEFSIFVYFLNLWIYSVIGIVGTVFEQNGFFLLYFPFPFLFIIA